MNPAIAIVGLACEYPDANSPQELWENALAQRRSFRRIPPQRLPLQDYFSSERSDADTTYATDAAVIDGYTFDRVKFRVSGDTYRAVDLTHWMALDVASRALDDAGFVDGVGLPRQRTGVLVGNTLTGEFSRANLMRLRWPYVRRALQRALDEEGVAGIERQVLFERFERIYKMPFPAVGEETLAGGLSNTIAGRICNHFDLKGGGYSVDGACASSLLAVTTACSALLACDVDVALAGGVDLSLDPFELIGFAKVGALASGEMRVFDAKSDGFSPGEGCGFVVLMRHDDAIAQARRIYATIRGWGVSSDGSGGITRPEVAGQLLALERAYRRAGCGVHTIPYFEAHGTGTSVGDTTELRALSQARAAIGRSPLPAAIGSIKANVGHTKAAAGVAGLIKATMALHATVLPPTTGCREPHPELTRPDAALRVLSEPEPWPAGAPLCAGVSAMGFGGINTHIVLQGTAMPRPQLASRERRLGSSPQDAELLVLRGSRAGVARSVDDLLDRVLTVSRAEVAALAHQLAATLGEGPVRVALVSSTATEIERQLRTVRGWLDTDSELLLDLDRGVFAGSGAGMPRIGFLFPGQASPSHLTGGSWRRRFECVRDLYGAAPLPSGEPEQRTSTAQPAIVTASLAGLRMLRQLGIDACVGVGHSLGELTALHWAGAIDAGALLRVATIRGQAMQELGVPGGAMASIEAGADRIQPYLAGADDVVIAGFNAPTQTVISGSASAVAAIVANARASGVSATPLPVSHAFHSSFVAPAASRLAAQLAQEDVLPLTHRVVSTVTGRPLGAGHNLRELLVDQVTAPVLFADAVAAASAGGVDLWLEVGPGRVLTGLVRHVVSAPVLPLDAGGPSLTPLLHSIAAAFAAGAQPNVEPLFADRIFRPFSVERSRRFFANPCELTPPPPDCGVRTGEQRQPAPSAAPEAPLASHPAVAAPTSGPTSSLVSNTTRGDAARQAPAADDASSSVTTLDVVRQLVAERVELPLSAVTGTERLLGDLHLNSIVVSQLVIEAARRRGFAPPLAPTEFSNATVAEIAQALDEQEALGPPRPSEPRLPDGLDSWVRPFRVDLVERPMPRPLNPRHHGQWAVVAPAGHRWAAVLEERLANSGSGTGVLVYAPAPASEAAPGLLLKGVHLALEQTRVDTFALVQGGEGAASLARTFFLENPQIDTCVVTIPEEHPDGVEWIVREVAAANGYREVHYDRAGRRREPVLRLLPDPVRRHDGTELGPEDVLLVSGGGKGIAAECAFDLARHTGVRLALLGRSLPGDDPVLAANLHRLKAAGVRYEYLPADVTDADAVQRAVATVESACGPITAILHGAGSNVPAPLPLLDEQAFADTSAPKVQGARNLLAAVDRERLKLFVAFGSVIARTGMRGEAHYALANERLALFTEQFQAAHAACRCLAVEWSVWAGVGMGERLGRIEALVREGITPIPLDDGVAALGRLIAASDCPVRVVVAARSSDLPTLKVDRPDLPLRRFIERPRVYYPDLELIVDADVCVESDPYLEDHRFGRERLFPAVMALEAMAEVAMALQRSETPPAFENVRFEHPIIVPDAATAVLRVAALVRNAGRVDVVVRSSTTAFQVDHFRATCHRAEAQAVASAPRERNDVPRLDAAGPDVDRELYGLLLFQKGRFQRVRRYGRLTSTACVAEVTARSDVEWFRSYLGSPLVLGDAGARDASLHAIQACLPHVTVLPISIERFVPAAAQGAGTWSVTATERCSDGDTVTYDVDVRTGDGAREQWTGLRLRTVGATKLADGWPESLLGPYIERRMRQFVPDLHALLARDADESRPQRSDRALRRLLNRNAAIARRPDGRPELPDDASVCLSVAHADDLVMVVAGGAPVGCDLEPVARRPEPLWADLLGAHRLELAMLIGREQGEPFETAATRVWTVGEALRKAGAPADAPLTLCGREPDGWVLMSGGATRAASYLATMRHRQPGVAIAVAMRLPDARV